MNTENREFRRREVKLARHEVGDMIFRGYGAVFDNVDAHRDMLKFGAFSDTLSMTKNGGDWPAMLSQHGGWGVTSVDLTPIGVWEELKEDNKGLAVSGVLAPTDRGKEAHVLLSMKPRPAIDKLSIGYYPKAWEMDSDRDGPIRILKKVDLVEISLVTFAANRKAKITDVKSLIDTMNLADIEALLREAALFSRSEAKYVVTRIRHLCQREASDDGLVELAETILNNTQLLRS